MRHEKDSQSNKVEHEVSELKSFQMPANLVVKEFGEVNVRQDISKSSDRIAECYVEFTIAMEPQGRFAEGWRTGLALDASASMKRAYGRKVEARVDPELLTDYIKQGRLRSYMEDGEPTRKIQREAFTEIQDRGYEVNYTENILQPLVQDFAAYLAESLDGTGKTSLIYWGCGKGAEIQVLGEFDAASCQKLAIAGPKTFQLGKTTKLSPAIAYFMHKYSQAQRGIYIFLTDGRIDDLEQVKNYTKELALEIAVGKRNYLKLILIGIGNDVDRYQMQELDDFDTGLDIDLWDYKIASEMTSLSQIFAEVVNENQIIAENGSIYDDAGNCVKAYPKGLPAKVDFVMRHDSSWFELEVGTQRIRQSVVLADSLGSSVAIAPLAKKKLFDFEIKAQASRSNSALGDQGVDQEIEQEHIPVQNTWWRLLTTLLIGSAFIGLAIALGILIKRSDDNKPQNKPISSQTSSAVSNTISNQTKTLEIEPKSASIDKSNSILSTSPSKTSSNIVQKAVSNPTNKNNSDNNSSNLSANQKEASNNSGKPTLNSSSQVTSSSNSNSSINPQNSASPKNSVSQTKNGDRNISPSILPIASPDVEAVIFFPSEESQLTLSEEAKIDNFWSKVQKRKGIIQVSGHADQTGDYAYNLDLSQSRANEVVRLLRDRGLDNNYKITFEALSWLQPLRKNITAADQAFNRRVVIQFKEQR